MIEHEQINYENLKSLILLEYILKSSYLVKVFVIDILNMNILTAQTRAATIGNSSSIIDTALSD